MDQRIESDPLSFAIAIATYNPDRRTLGRLLDAIQRLEGIGDVESVVIVDNNSKPQLINLPEVKGFLAAVSSGKYCYETVPGLTAARCRAIRETAADVIVFFDDDNEPDKDYLCILKGQFGKHSNVGVWGPGTIDVEFIDQTPDEIRKRSDIFQSRTRQSGFACIPGYYGEITPVGTGFAIRREVAEHYERLVAAGVLKITDRNGKSMSSGGDAQIIWEAAKLGYASGVIPELRCGHLINAAKANVDYIGRLNYGLAASHLPALAECYPDLAQSMAYVPSLPFVWKRLFKLQVKHWIGRSSNLERVITQASLLGSAYGSAIVKNDPRSERFKSLSGFYGFS